MNPTIAADVARCANARADLIFADWFDNPNGRVNDPSDRRVCRELLTARAFDPAYETPCVILQGEPVDADAAPVQFTNGITEDYAFSADEAASLHASYQMVGVPYTVRWFPVIRQAWGHQPATAIDPEDFWLEDEWLDLSPSQWAKR